MRTHRLDIEGMSCDHCVRAVRSALKQLPAVTLLEVEIGSALIDSDGSGATLERVARTIEDTGYRLTALDPVER